MDRVGLLVKMIGHFERCQDFSSGVFDSIASLNVEYVSCGLFVGSLRRVTERKELRDEVFSPCLKKCILSSGILRLCRSLNVGPACEGSLVDEKL